MRVHLVAVAGTGMGSLAGLLVEAGHEVSGSDVAFDPPMGPALRGWGVRLLEGFHASHLDPRPDLVVVGNVCRSDNAEARSAIDGGMPYTSMAQALANHVLAGTSPLVVAGTHGKTTTTALCAFLLHEAGRDAGFLVGGLPKDFDRSFRLPRARGRLPAARRDGLSPRSTPFVVEGDEYDTAFFEKTPKFWHYRPEVAIVTSIEHDHVDIYPDLASYEAAFREFLRRVPAHGLVVAAAHDPRVVRLVREEVRAEVAFYALAGDETHGAPPHWLGAPAGHDATAQALDLFAGGVSAGRAVTTLSGLHNARNALAALAAVTQGYGVPLPEAVAALARFQGIRRRQDLLGEVRGVRIYDDFAHHPTAVVETLRALRQKHPTGSLWAVFEPRSATACRSLHQDAYAGAFTAADRVLIAPLGRANVPPGERLDVDRLTSDLRGAGKDARAAGSIDDIVRAVATEARGGDVVAVLSNGAFGGIHERLLEALRR